MEVVDNGYSTLLDAVRSTFKIVIIALWASFQSGWFAPLFIVLPVVMLIRMQLSWGTSTVIRLKLFKMQNNMVAHAEECIRNYSLIRDYSRRPLMAIRLQSIVDDVNYFTNASWQHRLRNQLLLPVLSSLLVAILMATAPCERSCSRSHPPDPV